MQKTQEQTGTTQNGHPPNRVSDMVRQQKAEIIDLRAEQQKAIDLAKIEVTEVLRACTMQVSEVVKSLQPIIAGCEAEVDYTEDVNVVFQPDKAVFSQTRGLRIVKDKP